MVMVPAELMTSIPVRPLDRLSCFMKKFSTPSSLTTGMVPLPVMFTVPPTPMSFKFDSSTVRNSE